MRAPSRPCARGFSFLEVLAALSILLVGSVAILSLFAIGANEALQRKIDARLAEVRPEVLAILQDAVDSRPENQFPEPIVDRPLSRPDYSLDAEFRPSAFGGPRLMALAVILFRGQPVRVLPPIPISRSTLDPR